MPRPVTSKSRGICRYYNTARGCFAGNNCKFKHGEHEQLTPYDKSKTCRYFAAGYCKRGENCWFRHVAPSNPPADPSDPLICAICMEEPITFGLLVECSHVFCINCIRNWRGQDNVSDDVAYSQVHKKCPYCRTTSRFVVPSSHFYPSGHPGKATVIEQYKESLQRTPCKYFTASNPNHRYCPFGRDCMYQHLNEDGTPYIFTRGVDYYIAQRDRRLRGIFREVMTRSVIEYYHDFWIGSLDPPEEELPGELVFGEEAGTEQGGTDSEDDVYLTLTREIAAWNSNLDTPTPGPEDALTVFPSIPTIPVVALPAGPNPVPGSTHILTEPPDTPFRSIPSSPLSTSSMPSLLATSEFGTEPDHLDTTNASTLSEMLPDSGAWRPTDEPATISDRVPRPQSLPSTPPSPLSFPQSATCLDTGVPLSTSPVPSQMDNVECQSLPSPQTPVLEAPSVIEVGTPAGTQLPTRDPLPGEGSDTRQQEPPFMTDGRGRVVWSRSGVKPGSSPHSTRNQDRTANTAGDRD